jgi:hypothetical protein
MKKTKKIQNSLKVAVANVNMYAKFNQANIQLFTLTMVLNRSLTL